MVPYLEFWGKARGELPDQPAWHPNAYHCLDVAAVAWVLLEAFPRQLRLLARLLETTPDNLKGLLVAAIALHDIGKFGAAFQLKAPAHWPKVLGPLFQPGYAREGDHARLASSARLVLRLDDAFARWTGHWDGAQFDELWHAIAGHHGQPRVDAADPDPGIYRKELPPPALAAALAFRDEVLALFPGASPLPVLRQGDRRLAALTWFAAGLTVAADWIGSNRDWFPYVEAADDVPAYWPKALQRAAAAVAKSGLLPAAPNPSLAITDILPDGLPPSPLQEMMALAPLPQGPSLTIIEETTGSGKTEAALMLAARLIADQRASGLYFALPTMATADAMYRRMATHYRKVFAAGESPSLVLAHGKRHLSDGFAASIALGEAVRDGNGVGYEGEGAALCSAWLSDSKRKTFLAHIGVGTIDQALLGVLASRYQTLRLWGLADKVLILDEVHCYDAYMSREIERVLEFHAALGGSAILLSATLPERARGQLMAAFERGLGAAPCERGREQDAPPSNSGYPLVSISSAGERQLRPLATRPDRRRELAVRRLASHEAAADALIDAARKGAAVAWVRNAVEDAIEARELIAARAPDLTVVLLHSQFAMGDRLKIEDYVRTTLGRGEHAGRAGFVLIGTQILEASLDYDVDLMVSDLAPIDLLIQRAGRIWRHTDRHRRPLAAPELLVVSADPEAVTSADWYAQVSKRAPYVYAHHGVVWRSACELFKVGKIATPDGVRPLVEAVYAPAVGDLDNMPEPLRAASSRSVGSDAAARTFAKANLLNLDQGYAGNLTLWTNDTVTPTRLAESVTVFRLARRDGAGGLRPLCEAEDAVKSWALSEVSIALRKADGEVVPAGAEAAFARVKAEWPEWERDGPILLLDGEGQGQVSKDGVPVRVTYSAEQGLRLSKSGKD